MEHFALQYPWLIPALPLAAALLITLTGAKVLKGFSHLPAIFALLGSFVLSLALLAAFAAGQKPFGVELFQWINVGSFHADAALWIDQLTAIYLCFVTGIGLLIFIYAAGYMKGDYGYFRFFAFMSLFVFFMTMLVLAGNFVLLYLGWEGVGLSSYLLIGYYYPRPSAVAAAKKAFITNRIGDFGFALGIFLIFLTFSSVSYSDILFSPKALEAALAAHGSWLYAIPFLLMVGAFGKSAQFPLHVWLPDAMEGPTPVSALIHAATMVTAGIYMIARCLPLFTATGDHTALLIVACIGTFTAFLAASIALCQYDLKRIWAYSTLSQLGYMFLGLGVLAGTSAVFHVFTHAFFKALLFLAAGSVMHAMGGELDLRKMSGLRKFMPITTLVMLVGCCALAGVPGFSGFFSKDEILTAAFNYPGPLGWILGPVAMLVALMTAYYTFRLFFRVFLGPVKLPATAGHHEPSPFALAEEHGAEHHEEHAHTPTVPAVTSHIGHAEAASHGDPAHEPSSHPVTDGPFTMWGPLILLAIGAIAAGYIGLGEHNWFHHFLQPVLGQYELVPAAGAEPETGGMIAEHAERIGEHTMMVLSSVLALVGICTAAFFHLYNRHAADILAANLRPVQRFLENKWYIDEFYQAAIIKPLWIFAIICSYADRFVLDGMVFLIGFAPQLLGYSLKPTQRGLLQRYAVGMLAGLAIILIGILYLLR